MTSREVLTLDEISRELESLNQGAAEQWTVENQMLCREFVFGNFIEAFGFMSSAALEAEKMDHHPEWCNVYKTVSVKLTTHSSGGITALDFRLAQKMESLAGGSG